MKRACYHSLELATLTTEPFSDKNWIFEEKFDGIRCLAVRSNGKVSLYSRNRNRLDFPEIVKELESKKGKDFVADGEIVAFDGKVTSFSKLQNRNREKLSIYYYVFDLLFFDQTSLTNEPLLERKKILKDKFPFGKKIRYTPHVKEKGEAFFQRAQTKGLEGIIGKRIDSPYRSGRTRDWLKFKTSASQEFVIGGYTDPKGERIGFGALLVGYYDKKGFQYAGKVGTGFDTTLLSSLSKQLKSREQSSCPFFLKPKEKTAHFVRPNLMCEVGFTEWTKDGKLRHPRFLGLRKDKSAKSVKKEQN